jgi:hypothetical protein
METDPLDEVWQMIDQGWDIESRAWFEARAVPMGFKHPLSLAIHHLWKRCVKDNPAFLRQPVTTPLGHPEQEP